MANSFLNDNWVTHLLTLPTQAEQLTQLQSVKLADQAGLVDLLDYAEDLVQRNPGQAHQLALLCEQVRFASTTPWR